jgi:hypothetical protein
VSSSNTRLLPVLGALHWFVCTSPQSYALRTGLTFVGDNYFSAFSLSRPCTATVEDTVMDSTVALMTASFDQPKSAKARQQMARLDTVKQCFHGKQCDWFVGALVDGRHATALAAFINRSQAYDIVSETGLIQFSEQVSYPCLLSRNSEDFRQVGAAFRCVCECCHL